MSQYTFVHSPLFDVEACWGEVDDPVPGDTREAQGEPAEGPQGGDRGEDGDDAGDIGELCFLLHLLQGVGGYFAPIQGGELHVGGVLPHSAGEGGIC